MSTAMHTRFWKTMGERFGNRWFEAHGVRPTKAWCDLVDEFHEDLEAALLRLKDRPERERAHPPSHAEFQTLLVAAKKARGALDNATEIRNRWRAIVVGTCLRHCALLKLLPYGSTRLDQLAEHLYRSTFGICQELIAWACEIQAREGFSPGIEQHINATLWNHLRPYGQVHERPHREVPRETQLNTGVST